MVPQRILVHVAEKTADQDIQAQNQRPAQGQGGPQDMTDPRVLMAQGALVQQGVQVVDGNQALSQITPSNWLNLNDPDVHYPGQKMKQGITTFLFGAPGTWKTTWAGQ